MFVRVDRSITKSLVSIQRKLMKGYRGRQEKLTYVVSIRGANLLAFLDVVYRYATVDEISLLPIFILFNTAMFISTLVQFEVFR